MGGPLNRRRAAWLIVSLTIVTTAASAWLAASVYAKERYFAGSAQLDYLQVLSNDTAREITFDGFTTELSLKIDVDANDHLAFSVKTCYGCHGFEIGLAYADIHVVDEFSIRVGRIIPSFGDFPERHDPANHRTSDKPLPYDMGRMLRLRDFNMSILPAPYVDNGLELRGTIGLGEVADLDYAAYVIGGLRGGADATDVDFVQSRSPALYFVDNNSQPTVGGRLALGIQLGEIGRLRVGGSAMYGTYDPNNELDILVLGADLVLKIERWVLRMEYLVRRTRMALGADPAKTFRYGPGADGQFDPFFLKEGWYAETEYPIYKGLDLLFRFDGIRRRGNIAIDSPLRSDSMVLRYTGALAYRVFSPLRVKLSAEFYDFSDFADETALHLGVVGSF